MKRYQKVELFNIDNVGKFLGEDSIFVEMTPFELSFLFGLIEQERPTRMLEVGVAAGGGTAAILGCMQELKLDCKLFSVDLSEAYWKDDTQKTGFVLNRISDRFINKPVHREFYGKVVAAYLEEICCEGKIDFLILDAAHYLPGEILDFLVCLPYLADGAIVVLHDVGLSHSFWDDIHQNATRILFDTVTADKFYMVDGARESTNIAAFRVTEDTRENIIDLFSALSFRWGMMPDQESLDLYCQTIKRHYDDDFYQMLEDVILLQKATFAACPMGAHCKATRYTVYKRWAESKLLFLYGNGFWGKRHLEYAKYAGLRVDGIIVSDDRDVVVETEVPVYRISDIPPEYDEFSVVLALSKEYHDICMKNLENSGRKYNIINMD